MAVQWKESATPCLRGRYGTRPLRSLGHRLSQQRPAGALWKLDEPGQCSTQELMPSRVVQLLPHPSFPHVVHFSLPLSHTLLFHFLTSTTSYPSTCLNFPSTLTMGVVSPFPIFSLYLPSRLRQGSLLSLSRLLSVSRFLPQPLASFLLSQASFRLQSSDKTSSFRGKHVSFRMANATTPLTDEGPSCLDHWRAQPFLTAPPFFASF